MKEESPLSWQPPRGWAKKTMARAKPERCSFCGRGEAEVTRLVQGGGAAICGRCAVEVLDILRADVAEERIPPLPGLGVPEDVVRLVPHLKRIAKSLELHAQLAAATAENIHLILEVIPGDDLEPRLRVEDLPDPRPRPLPAEDQ